MFMRHIIKLHKFISLYVYLLDIVFVVSKQSSLFEGRVGDSTTFVDSLIEPYDDISDDIYFATLT